MKKLKIGRTIFIERTKDFYIQKGWENKPDMKEAIRIRELMGDKLKLDTSNTN